MSTSSDIETVRSARPEHSLVRPDEDRPRRLIYDPEIVRSGPSRFQVRGEFEDKTIVAWGFWGGVLVAAVSLALIFNSRAIYTPWDMIWSMLAIVVGVFLYRFGKRSSLREEVLCEIDLLRGEFAWRSGDDGRLAIGFDDITEIVYGMTKYPVSERRSDVYVHAFTLLVRDGEERLIPVVEATPDKEKAHAIAETLSRELRMSISYVGEGISG